MRAKILIQHRLLYFNLYLLDALLELTQPFNNNLQFFLPDRSLWKIHEAFLQLKRGKKHYLQLQKKLNDEEHIVRSIKEIHLLNGINSHIKKACWNIYFIFQLVTDSLNENLMPSWNGYDALSNNLQSMLDKIRFIFYFNEGISSRILKYGDINKQELEYYQGLIAEIKNSNKAMSAIQGLLAILEKCKDSVKNKSVNDVYFAITLTSNIPEYMLKHLVKNINYFGKKNYGDQTVTGEVILYFLFKLCNSERIICLLAILLSNYQNLQQMLTCLKDTQQMLVHSICKEKYVHLLRLQILYTVHSSWLNILNEIKSKNLSSSLHSDLTIARILFRKKYYYSEIYQKINTDISFEHQKLLEFILKHDTTVSDVAIVLEAQLANLRSKNATTEIELKNKLKYKYAALILLLLTENFFFKMGNELYIALEEYTHTERFKNVPILNVKMDENFINFFATLNGAIFLGAEVYGSAWTGLSYNMIHLITPLFFNDFDFLTRCFKFFKRDEITAIQYLPLATWMEGMLIYSLFYASIYGMHPALLGYFIVNYAMSMAGRELLTLLFNKLTSNKSTIQSSLFIKTIFQYFGYLVGAQVWHSMVTHFKEYFTVYARDELLNDKQWCMSDRLRCRQYAAEILDLNIDASSTVIRKRFRELALLSHPDKIHLNNNNYQYNFFQLTSAKQRLLELNTEAFNNYEFGF